MTGGWNLHRRREQQWQPPLPAPGQALQSYTAGLSNWWLGNRLGNSPGQKQNKSYKEVLFQVLIKVQKKHFSWSFRCYCEIPLEKDGKRRHVHVKKRFLTWNLGDDMGMAQQAAEDPMHQIQWFIMAKSSFSRCIDGGFGLCPNYLGLNYTPGPLYPHYGWFYEPH